MTTDVAEVEPPNGFARDDSRERESRDTDDITLWTGLAALIPFARYGAWGFAAAAVLAALSSLALLGPFWAVYRAVDDLVLGEATRNDMYLYAALAAVFIVLQYFLMAAALWISHMAAYATLEQVRLQIGERLGRVPLGFLTNRRSGEVQRTLSDDVERLEIFLAHAIPDLFSALTTSLFLVAWLLIVDVRMGLAGIAVVVVAFVLTTIGSRRGSRKMGAYTRSLGRMNASVVEFVRAMPVVRTFNGTRRVFGETRSAIDDAAEFQSQWAREFVPLYTAFFVVLTSPVLIIVPVGLWLWHADELSTSALLFFFIVGLGFTLPILRVQQVMTQLSYLALGARLVNELDAAEVLDEPSVRAELASGRVEVRNVDFAYAAEDGSARQVLFDVSFTAEPGTVTAIVGPSGSGKSTLARLIARFWDVDGGAVLVGGVDVREMPAEQLMERLAFVFQETFLFDDTVTGNLRIANPEATDEQLIEAAKAARAHEFILGLPDGYDTSLGEGGARLSGGERQRLAIARAVLKDAPIVLLDEATAYADPENEVALQEALNSLVAGRTVIVIAHRLSTIAGADQTLVLADGRIVERGQHDELIAANGLYTELWEAFSDASEIAVAGGSSGAAVSTAGEEA